MRAFLFRRLSISTAHKVLEVGCGTGAITTDTGLTASCKLYGLDIDLEYLSIARKSDTQTHFTAANAMETPFPKGVFDVVYCHYFLLWMKDIPAVLAEMRRVTRPGGVILALAEPDYGGRIDYPPSLAELGQWQAHALARQGAHPEIGRRLLALFTAAGFVQVEAGLMGGQWKATFDSQAFENEWKVLQDDLDGMVSPARLQALRQMDEIATQKGERILFVPTFYASGKVPS